MKQVMHGLRHGMKIEDFVADTKSDNEWVILLLNDVPFARQRKTSREKRYRQGSNPDYKGYDAYRLEVFHCGKWIRWDDGAEQGTIKRQAKRLCNSVRKVHT